MKGNLTSEGAHRASVLFTIVSANLKINHAEQKKSLASFPI